MMFCAEMNRDGCRRSKAETEDCVAVFPAHFISIFLRKSDRRDVFDLLWDSVWHRAEIGAEDNSIDTAHLDCGPEPKRTEPKRVNE